jgi:hypothetical protein
VREETLLPQEVLLQVDGEEWAVPFGQHPASREERPQLALSNFRQLGSQEDPADLVPLVFFASDLTNQYFLVIFPFSLEALQRPGRNNFIVGKQHWWVVVIHHSSCRFAFQCRTALQCLRQGLTDFVDLGLDFWLTFGSQVGQRLIESVLGVQNEVFKVDSPIPNNISRRDFLENPWTWNTQSSNVPLRPFQYSCF